MFHKIPSSVIKTLGNFLYTLIIWLSLPSFVYAQPGDEMTRQSFLSVSNAFAYDLGKTYQMGKNCKKDLYNIAFSKAEELFFRYMERKEIQHAMLNYEEGAKSMLGAGCERKELKAFMSVLHTRIDRYFKLAAPFTHSNVDSRAVSP
jgi:hypothetical protein